MTGCWEPVNTHQLMLERWKISCSKYVGRELITSSNELWGEGEKEVLRSIRVGHTISFYFFSLLPSFGALFRKMEKDEFFALTYAEIPCYKMTTQE